MRVLWKQRNENNTDTNKYVLKGLKIIKETLFMPTHFFMPFDRVKETEEPYSLNSIDIPVALNSEF